ncbi:MAG TPA: hypothetical protein PKY86_00640 [Niabella sp.]|nr:hypothetical protein [Niabella sp.]HQW14616.1 hypothetical protein [Niabella sp.]HQX42748.1 hypothetical protein [Niabella sp.]HRB08425.1 hypothetical protein [Niabella sp.]HRB78685.1 hypothetical protein [Niabella sp.]
MGGEVKAVHVKGGGFSFVPASAGTICEGSACKRKRFLLRSCWGRNDSRNVDFGKDGFQLELFVEQFAHPTRNVFSTGSAAAEEGEN